MAGTNRRSIVSRWALVAVGGLLSGTSACEQRCNLSAELASRAGGGAIACGHVALGGVRTATDACVAAAFQDQKPFQASYEIQGTDSHVAAGVVRNGAGEVTFLLYDGNIGGGGGDSAAVISATACDGPALRASLETRPDGTPPLSCAATRDLGHVCQ